MTGPLSGIRPLNPAQAIRDVGGAARPGAVGAFADSLNKAIGTVDSMQKSSQVSVDRLLSGEVEDLHKVALENQRAALAFDLLLQVRNKAVQAYQEVMRMQV